MQIQGGVDMDVSEGVDMQSLQHGHVWLQVAVDSIV